MKNNIKIGLEQKADIPHGEKGIMKVGHRQYVGGNYVWFLIGQLQFDFLIAEGLKPYHVLLDIACGALRGGRLFIPYLNAENYLGLDKERLLIDRGIEFELSKEVLTNKKPQFSISENFDFSEFHKTPDFALAQSLFTHLSEIGINKCLNNLRSKLSKKGVFYASFFISDEKIENPLSSHDHLMFWYTRKEIQDFGRKNGYEVDIIGSWNHPRGQQMVKFMLE